MMSSGSNNNKRDFSHSKRTFRKQTLFGIVFGIVMMIALALGAAAGESLREYEYEQ